MDRGSITCEMDVQRRMVAYKTTQAWQQIPHVSFMYEPDVTDFYEEYRALREEFRSRGEELSLNTIFMKAVVEALKVAPQLNAFCHFDPKDNSGRVEMPSEINVGIPWLLDDGGMITLTAYNMGEKTLGEMSAEVASIRAKVANTDFGKLFRATAMNMPYGDETTIQPRDITGGTITISNLGSICRTSGAVALLEIIPPQVCAIGLASLADKPGVFVGASGEKEIGIRKMISMCIAFDHRALDFGDVVPFINKLDEIFANPSVVRGW